MSTLKAEVERLTLQKATEETERVRQSIVALMESIERAAEATTIPHARLSRREREVMSMMLDGARLKEIAGRLEISVKTVTTHRSRLMKKLAVDDNLSLYRYGIRNGLITV